MEGLLIYFLKLVLTSGVMYGYYLLFLKDKTFHHYNRFYLIFLVLMSLSLPLLKISYFTIEVEDGFRRFLNPIQVYKPTSWFSHELLYRSLFMLIGSVSVILLFRLVRNVADVFTLKRRFPKQNIKGISFYITALENAPFSFFKNLFWKESLPLDSNLGRQILKHEMVHIEQKHSYDKVFVELIQKVFWFNPIFYLVKKELNLIHEYLADNKAVRNKDTKVFAQMLLQTHFSAEVFPMTHPFINSHIKKRLKMLQKSKTKYAYIRKLAVLPVVFCTSFVLLVNAKNKEIKKVNKEIKTALSEVKQDTIRHKTTSIKYVVKSDFKEITDEGAVGLKTAYEDLLKDAKSSDVFMVQDKKVSEKKFRDFIAKNYKNRNLSISYVHKKDASSVYRVSLKKKIKTQKMSTKDKGSVVVQAVLTDMEEPDTSLVDEKNTLFYVQDELVSKKVFDEFVRQHQGTNGFEFLKSINKRGGKNVYSVAKAKKGDTSNKELHTKFMKRMEEKIQKRTKNIKVDVVTSKGNENSVVLESGKEFRYTNKGDGTIKINAEKIKLTTKEIDSLKKNKNPWLIGVKAVGSKEALMKAKKKMLIHTIYLDDNGEQEIMAIQNDNIRPPVSTKNIKFYVNGKVISENDFRKLDKENIKSINVIKNKYPKNHQIEIFTK